MAFGLVFLLFLPIGIPLSLIIIPFLAGRSGAKELPKDWHSTFVITVGGGCSLGLVFALYLILSLSLGPSLKIGIAEPAILALVAAMIWGSFFIGVKNSKGTKTETQINEEEWEAALEDYYRLCDWDVDTGHPSLNKMESLGLGWVVADNNELSKVIN